MVTRQEIQIDIGEKIAEIVEFVEQIIILFHEDSFVITHQAFIW